MAREVLVNAMARQVMYLNSKQQVVDNCQTVAQIEEALALVEEELIVLKQRQLEEFRRKKWLCLGGPRIKRTMRLYDARSSLLHLEDELEKKKEVLANKEAASTAV